VFVESWLIGPLILVTRPKPSTSTFGVRIWAHLRPYAADVVELSNTLTEGMS